MYLGILMSNDYKDSIFIWYSLTRKIMIIIIIMIIKPIGGICKCVAIFYDGYLALNVYIEMCWIFEVTYNIMW